LLLSLIPLIVVFLSSLNRGVCILEQGKGSYFGGKFNYMIHVDNYYQITFCNCHLFESFKRLLGFVLFNECASTVKQIIKYKIIALSCDCLSPNTCVTDHQHQVLLPFLLQSDHAIIPCCNSVGLYTQCQVKDPSSCVLLLYYGPVSQTGLTFSQD